MHDPLRDEVRRLQLRGAQLRGLSEAGLRQFNERTLERVRRRLNAQQRAEMDANLAASGLPTDLQSPAYYTSLKDAYDRVKTGIGCCGETISPTPLLASAYGGDITGHALFLPPERYAIILDETLFDLCIVLPKLLLAGITPKADESFFTLDRDILLARLSCSPRLQEQFDDMVLSYLIKGSVSKASYVQLPSDPELVKVVGHVGNGIRFFVMGHEYGHILHGHFTDQNHDRVLSSDDLGQIDMGSGMPNFYHRHFLEFQADVRGIQACLRCADDHRVVELNLFGALAYLYVLDLLEHAVILWVSGKNSYEAHFGGLFDTFMMSITTHPAGTLRAARTIYGLLEELEQMGDETAQFRAAVHAIDFTIRTILKGSWTRFVAQITQADIDRYPLSPLWGRKARRLAARTPVRRYDWDIDDMADFLTAEAAARAPAKPLF
jgi:hypothetical protein